VEGEAELQAEKRIWVKARGKEKFGVLKGLSKPSWNAWTKG